jgi:integrase/recombinase XerD
LSTIYSCGLRLNEALQLTISDIDGERMVIHVRSGKGGKDRYVPLPNQTYHLLRQFWATHKHPKWLFPGRGADRKKLSNEASGPMPRSYLQVAFRKAVKASRIQKAATIHTLRHSYATHLLDAGVNLRQIQSYLGHSSLASTMIYMHLTQKGQRNTMKILDQLMVGFNSSTQLKQS